MALLSLIIGVIIARLFWRQIVTLTAWLTFLGVCAVLVRAAPHLGVSSAWLTTFYGAALVGFLAGGALALRPIINYLIESDYRRAVERARDDADKRRL